VRAVPSYGWAAHRAGERSSLVERDRAPEAGIARGLEKWAPSTCRISYDATLFEGEARFATAHPDNAGRLCNGCACASSGKCSCNEGKRLADAPPSRRAALLYTIRWLPQS